MSTPSVERSPLLGAVVETLGDRHVVTFAGSKAHTPRETVLEGAAAARDAGADALVALGGSSVVDMTKGVAMVLAEGDDLDAMTMETGNRLATPKLAHIAVPTTLSAAEFTAAAGITNTVTGVKELFVSATLAPRWVILDPEMTAATPERLWAGTGMKLVADCIEGMLSPRSTQYANALLQGALAILLADLAAPADQLEARGRCLEAAHMTLSNLHNVGIRGPPIPGHHPRKRSRGNPNPTHQPQPQLTTTSRRASPSPSALGTIPTASSHRRDPMCSRNYALPQHRWRGQPLARWPRPPRHCRCLGSPGHRADRQQSESHYPYAMIPR